MQQERLISFLKRFMHGALAPLILASAAPIAAQTRSIPFDVLAPAAVSHVQPLAPGGSLQFSFSLRSGAEAGLAMLRVDVLSRPEALSQYSFASSDPSRCREPEIERREYSLKLAFPIGPIGQQEIITCTYTVTRSLSSNDDLGLVLCDWLGGPCRLASFLIGTLPRMRLEVVPATGTLPDGSQLVRLVVRNDSPVAVASRVVGTNCAEFGGGEFFPVAFTLDTDFPGGCPATIGQACLNFAGQGFSSYGFELGPVAPGSTSSCLVRLVASGRTFGYSRVGVGFVEERVWLADGALGFDPGFVFDPSTTNGGGSIVFGVLPPVPALAVPIAPWSLPALATLLLGMVAWAVRRKEGVRGLVGRQRACTSKQ